MNHRLRYAMKDGGFGLLTGEVEADETFIGGKTRNMHIEKRKRRITVTGGKDKTTVISILERGGKVRTGVVPNGKKKAIQAESAIMLKPDRRCIPASCFPQGTGRGTMRIGWSITLSSTGTQGSYQRA
jgi:hypothetical protein